MPEQKDVVSITQINNRYLVEVNEERLHMLNERSLKWNLKRVFKLNQGTIDTVMIYLYQYGKCQVNLNWTEKKSA